MFDKNKDINFRWLDEIFEEKVDGEDAYKYKEVGRKRVLQYRIGNGAWENVHINTKYHVINEA